METNYAIRILGKSRRKKKVNPRINRFAKTVFKQVSENGVKKTLKKKNLKALYTKIVVEETDKTAVKGEKAEEKTSL